MRMKKQKNVVTPRTSAALQILSLEIHAASTKDKKVRAKARKASSEIAKKLAENKKFKDA